MKENKQVRQVLGISGGKDSAALAIYLKNLYPNLEIDYYTCDTGKELDETYELIDRLNGYLGKPIKLLQGKTGDWDNPFDFHYENYGGYLPSSNARWCTKKLKLEPFENYVGDQPTISYVGIRGDEDREGYISTKTNIQAIFPFRQNIWSEDVTRKVLKNESLDQIRSLYKNTLSTNLYERASTILSKPLSMSFTMNEKLNALMSLGIKEYNGVVFEFLKTTDFPIAYLDSFPLIDNEDNLVRDDIFKLLRESGVGVPAYYDEISYEINGQTGKYNRSRSGCFFCFFQRKIEWVWLYEQNPGKFFKAMEYEKEGYSWMQEERLEELINPNRIRQIKEDYLLKQQNAAKNSRSDKLVDILDDEEEEGCAACFI